MQLQSGQRIGRYEIVAAIGAGGMGEVFCARDTALDRDVAIKVLPPEFACDERRRARFEREAKTISQLHHPNICTVYDVGENYLVMELLEGETLADRLARGPLATADVYAFGAQIAEALDHAHRAGIVHRDLKPGNVMITSSGAKLLDFGLAKSLPPDIGSDDSTRSQEQSLTATGTIVGTLHYMAPEQVEGRETDARTDIFALGAMLYEMATGVRAFNGATTTSLIAAILEHEPAPISHSNRALPLALQAVITRCLKKRPSERYSSADEIAAALRTLSGSGRLPIVGWWPRARVTFHAQPVSPQRVLTWVGAACVLTLVVIFGVRFVRHRMLVAWARNDAIPQIMRLAERGESWQAFLLARRVDPILPGEPLLAKIRPQFAAALTWRVKPDGASVWVRPSTGREQPWVLLGRPNKQPIWTPLGCMAFKIEHPACTPRVVAFALWYLRGTVVLNLPRSGEVPREMTRIDSPDPDTLGYLFKNDFGRWKNEIGTFLIDTYEVRNRQYKTFVDAGGYRRREFWKFPVTRGGQEIPWEEAMALFVDTTGRPGPANWELGSYPEGKADYPVTGVSWFEASAYAEWAGKRLPTIFHWRAVSGKWASGCVVSGSNFSGRLAPVGSYGHSLNLWGLYDMAGNAGEWCSNAVRENRATVGGSCDGPEYMFFDADSHPPLDRNPTRGFRCMKPLEPATVPQQLERPFTGTGADLRNVKPFADDVWKTWISVLKYDKASLDSRIEIADEAPQYWRMQKVSFAAAYGGERMLAYLYIPKNARPPYQTVVFWPGSVAENLSSSENGRNISDSNIWGYFVRDGRAVLYPILKGTYERGGGIEHGAMDSLIMMQVKDVMRSIDYLASRSDIDSTRLAFFGFSWGAYSGTLTCARETRFKTGILMSGGAFFPEVLGWAHRVVIPIQMVNGRYDSLISHERNQLPLFEALGTPDKDKRLVLLNTDHALSGAAKEVAKANLEWLDRYLGPVRK